LDVLLNATVDEVEAATIQIIQATRNYKHMVAATDYLFYDVPLESVKTMVRTVKNYRG
jgi:hypothetical protein